MDLLSITNDNPMFTMKKINFVNSFDHEERFVYGGFDTAQHFRTWIKLFHKLS